VAIHRKRRAAGKLLEEGKPLKAVAKQLRTDVATLKTWLKDKE
jgi:hypothetical protein